MADTLAGMWSFVKLFGPIFLVGFVALVLRGMLGRVLLRRLTRLVKDAWD